MVPKQIVSKRAWCLALPWVLGLCAAAPGWATEDGATVAVLQVRPNVYMITVGGINSAVAIGPEGAVVVNPGPARSSEALLAAIKGVTHEPIRYVINTNGDPELIGGNEAVSRAGYAFVPPSWGGPRRSSRIRTF